MMVRLCDLAVTWQKRKSDVRHQNQL